VFHPALRRRNGVKPDRDVDAAERLWPIDDETSDGVKRRRLKEPEVNVRHVVVVVEPVEREADVDVDVIAVFLSILHRHDAAASCRQRLAIVLGVEVTRHSNFGHRARHYARVERHALLVITKNSDDLEIVPLNAFRCFHFRSKVYALCSKINWIIAR